MSGEMARILVRLEPDLEYDEVPAVLVPAGYLRIHLKDHGEFYAPPAVMSTFQDHGPVHPPFPAEVRDIFGRFERLFAEVYPRTVEQWEDGFRRDAHPWGEIAHWQLLADTVERFTAHLAGGDDELTREKRRDVERTVLDLQHLPAAKLKIVLDGRCRFECVRTLTPNRVREIARWMFSEDCRRLKNGRREDLRKLIQGPGLPGPDRVPIDALFGLSGVGVNLDADFDPTDLINAADVVLGVSRADGHSFVMFGRDTLERVAAGQAGPANILHVEMDQESDDLEKMAALLVVLKGRHDYRAR